LGEGVTLVIGSCRERKMGLFNWLFRKMCNRIFSTVDIDKSGFIEALEVEVAIYRRVPE
jgi:hypothetical protein